MPMPQSPLDILSLMKNLESAPPTDDDRITPPVGMCFETWHSRKREAKLFGTFLSLTLPILAVIMPLALVAVADEIGLPIVPAAVIAGLVAIFALWKCYNCILSTLGFCIIFHESHLQIGRGLAKRIFPYEDIEIVYLHPVPIVKARCRGRTASVWLTERHRLLAAFALRDLCRNAVFVSAGARSHLLPTDPTNPKKTLQGLAAHYRRHALIGGLFICYLLWLTAILIYGLMQWQNGNVVLRILLQEMLLHFFIGVVLITFGGIVWRSWCTARTIRAKLAEAVKSAGLAGRADTFDVSEDSLSRPDDAL
jgi:hypothetical protein